MFCFDTRIYPTDLKSDRLYGFGGTSFHMLEQYIQRKIESDKIKYPKAVFVITDGYGTNIDPQFPKNWSWFLTPGGARYCIPKECNVYDLKNYE